MSILTRLRLSDSPRYIWADAICINQRNKSEISLQMTLMREIYQRATRVIVWLGEDTDGKAAEACEFMALSENHVPLGKSWWSSIAAFYGCKWFSRFWVFQEISMARSADVLWGDTSISWKVVSRATALVRTLCYRELARTPIPNLDNAYLFHQWSNIRRQNGHPQETFLYMLQVTRKLQCKVPKDHVYGLLGFRVLGIEPDKGDLFLEPDARRSTWSVYRRVARKALRQMQSLDVLSAVQHKSKIHRPTWVPRWNTWSVHSLTPLGIAAERYAASRHLPAPSIRWAGPNGEMLQVSGIEFDGIITTTPKIPDSMHSCEQTTALRDIIDGLLNSVHPYPTGELYDLVTCWTLSAGKDWYGMIVQNVLEHLDDFAAFCAQNKVRTRHRISMLQGHRLGDALRFATAAGYASGGRRLFHTSGGYLGIGPAIAQHGDKVCILSGGATPFILRHMPHAKKSSRRFLLIGEAYVHGIMEGNIPLHKDDQRKPKRFEIV